MGDCDSSGVGAGQATLQERIEQLRAELAGGPGEGALSARQADKRERLQQKLRYLEFFQCWRVAPCPADWHCRLCREQQRTRRLVGARQDSWRAFTRVTEWACAVENKAEHERQWEAGEKARPEVRAEIKRAWAALVRREREVGRTRRESVKATDFPAPDPVIKPRPRPAPVQAAQKSSYYQGHGESCRTCARMQSLTGTIVPHPAN